MTPPAKMNRSVQVIVPSKQSMRRPRRHTR
jgi:hypothetical protein